MTPDSTSTTGDMPIPPEPPREPSVDLDGELQLASLHRRWSNKGDQPIRYREWDVERRLGAGGMGAVYLARNRELDRRVALKVVRPGSSKDAKARALRLIREAQALARIDHEHVLRIHQVDTSGSRAVIEMEYVDGPTLREWQAAPGRKVREIIAAYADIGDGLAAIHRAGLLHRDIKPDNLLVDGSGRVKVADLGLAVADRSDDDAEPGDGAATIDRDSSLARQLTATGAWVGTHGYMAPEVIAGNAACPASDQFSLAISLYEAVYGTRPFRGDTPEELAVAMEAGELAPPRDDRWRPRWLMRVLRRALRFDPAARYASVDAFVGALRRRLRVRAWIVGGLALALLAGGAGALGWYGKPTRADPCADVGSEIVEAWNQQIRSTLEAAVHPDDAKAFELLVHTLDTRTAAWAETRTQLCVAQSRRDPEAQPVEAELDARQRACLRYARVNIEALVEQLGAVDEQAARHYTETAAALEALPTCTERRGLMDWPVDVTNDDLDAELARALALEASGRYPEAEAVAREVAQTSEGADPLREAEALYRLGHVLGLQRRDRPALEALDRARNVAFRIGHDELVCRATAFQAKLGAGVRRDPDAARRELGLAQACVERLGARSPILRADLLEARGLLARAAGEPETAVEWHEEALALRREHLGDAHPDTIKSLHNLANAMLAADPDGARTSEVRRLYTEALDAQARVLPASHPATADLLFDLGRFSWQRGELEQAREFLVRAAQIYESAGEPGAVQARVELILAHMDIESEHLDEGQLHLERARDLLDTDEHSFGKLDRARWLHLDGALALRRLDYERAADSSRRATKLYRRLDPHSEEARDSLVDEIAADYGLQDYARIAAIVRDESEALAEYLRSLPATEAGPLAWYLGIALEHREAWADAAVYFEIALDSYEKTDHSSNVAQLRVALARAQAQLETPPNPKGTTR